jgi:hypothetical protein
VNNEAVGGGWLQAGGFSYGAVYISGLAAEATDYMVVVISHPRFKASRMAGWLNPSYQPRIHENMKVIIYRLCGERAKPLASGLRNRFRISMLAPTLDRSEYCKPRPGHS